MTREEWSRSLHHRIPAISIHPESASSREIAHMAADLMEARKLLCQTWNHMHGQNMDGTRRAFDAETACHDNWVKLGDAIGKFIERI